ncbi:hypothetical protein AOLI_G00198390 [Acnodon oligacanthus]
MFHLRGPIRSQQTQTSASNVLTIFNCPAPVSEMQRSRVALITVICVLFSRISEAEVEMRVRPGDDVTLYSDCVWKSGFNIVWFRNSSKAHHPPLIISTEDFMRGARPCYSFVWNPSSETHDLLVKNVSESDLGLYYCAVHEKKITEDESGVILAEDVYHYGSRITRLSLVGSEERRELLNENVFQALCFNYICAAVRRKLDLHSELYSIDSEQAIKRYNGITHDEGSTINW